MSSIWDMILQWGSTIGSIELPVATRHRRDMTEKWLKVMLNQNKQTNNETNKNLFISIHNYTETLKICNV